MGKEAKIGLCVIGVLLVAFGALLTRRLLTSDLASATATPPPKNAAAPASGEKPTVVTAQRDSREQQRAAGRNPWKRGDDAGDTSDVPRASYMPADSSPAESQPRERLVEETEGNVDSADQTPSVPGSSPFDRRSGASPGVDEQSAEPRRLDSPVVDGDSGDTLPQDQPTLARSRRGSHNTVRRASVEFPIEDTADTPIAEPLEPSDRQDRQPVEAAQLPAEEPAAELPRYQEEPAEIPANTRVEQAAPVQTPAASGDWRGAVEPVSNTAPETVPVENGKYTVQPNDNLWIISEKVYGSGRYFKALVEHNRNRLPRSDRLAVGTIVAVPPVEELERAYPALCPKQRRSAVVKPRTMQASTRARQPAGSSVYVVEEGDTLFDIARLELGKASRWAEIYDLNRETLGEDFDYLQPGTELAMPAKGSPADSITRQRDNGYQR